MNPVLKVLLWMDIKILWFGRCKPGETISAAAWSLEADSKWQGKLLRPAIDFIFWPVRKNHCVKAWDWQRHLYLKG